MRASSACPTRSRRPRPPRYDAPNASTRRIVGRRRVEPDAPALRLVTGPATTRAFLDLHCHSSASFDSLARPVDLVRVAAERGLTHVAITDHERIDGALRAGDAAPAGLTVIVGEEVRTAGGDMIGLFLSRAVPPGMSPQETAAAIREQGGIVGIPHPFDRFRRSGLHMAEAAALEDLAMVADYLEIHNARVPFGNANERAAELARHLGIPGIAASDAHSTIEVGVAYTIADGPITGAADLRAALPAAEVVPGRASYVVRALTPLAKAVNAARGNRRVRPELVRR